MHSKQRQFWGDNRPSMMARQSTLIDPNALTAPLQPLVQNDDDLLSPLPRSVAGSQPGSSSKRPNTMHDVPALNLPSGDGGDSAADQRMGKSRSVFGVDTLWEREMVKLKGLQEAQSKADAEAAAKEAEKERKKAERAEKRKSRWGRKSKMLDASDVPQFDEQGRPISMTPVDDGGMGSMNSESRMSRLSMMDPRMGSDDIEELDGRYDESNASTAERVPARPPTLSFEPESPAIGSIEPEQPAPPPERRPGSRLGVDDWFQSSDEEDGGNGGRNSRNRPVSAQPPQLVRPVSDGESSEEELPLSRLRRVAVDDDDSSSDEDVPLSRIKAQVADSDEEVPLSQLKKGGLPKLDTDVGSGSLDLLPSQASPRSPGSGAVSDAAVASGEASGAITPLSGDAADVKSPVSVPAISTPANDEDDDEPLLIRQARRSRMVMSPAGGESAASGSNAGANQTVEEIEDDLPLAWKHAGAAQRQHEARKGASPQPGMQHMPSFYGSPYGMPGMTMSAYGMPQMGMMQPSPMMGMPMQQPMMPQMMGGMPGMGMGGMPGMGMPGMGGMGMPPSFEDPGSNIDHWRKQVELAPMPTGSGQSVSTRGP